MNFQVVNILETEKRLSSDGLNSLLSSFSCPQNKHIEHFLLCNALACAKQRFAITYLVLNQLGELVGFFTLAHKPVFFEKTMLDGKRRRRVKQFCVRSLDDSPETDPPLLTSAFLIAQLAKNSSELDGDKANGGELLDFAIQVLEDIQQSIGGGIIFLECENQQKLLDFYQKHGFRKFGERSTVATGEFYHQLLMVF